MAKKNAKRRRKQLDEDAQHTIIFVDMLGFAELTKNNPTRLVHDGPDERGFSRSSASPLQTQLNKFRRIMESCIAEQRLFRWHGGDALLRLRIPRRSQIRAGRIDSD